MISIRKGFKASFPATCKKARIDPANFFGHDAPSRIALVRHQL
jgi:hypothetical protein